LQAILARTEDFVDGAVAGPVVEDAGAAADGGFLVQRQRCGDSRRQIVVVDEDVLPVVTQSRGHGKTVADRDLILDERAEDLCRKTSVPSPRCWTNDSAVPAA